MESECRVSEVYVPRLGDRVRISAPVPPRGPAEGRVVQVLELDRGRGRHVLVELLPGQVLEVPDVALRAVPEIRTRSARPSLRPSLSPGLARLLLGR